jgi:hypothetical protein
VPFNEGWGQFETKEVTDFIRRVDPSRLVDSTTGWTDRGVGDFHDIHVYPGPGAPKPETGRGSLLGEFGGLGLVVPGHTWLKEGWGYQSFKTHEELTTAIEKLFLDLRILKDTAGLSGAIYTQTTDVETELNGIMTYDRAMIKPDAARLKKAVLSVYKPAPKITTVLPTSELTAQTWSYTMSKPADAWHQKDFDDSTWTKGKGGFGTAETPGAVVGTEWRTSDIWLRREFNLPAAQSTKNLYLKIHHDDDVEVYLDGKLIFAKPGWTTNYTLMHWPAGLGDIAKGPHTLAVYCHQNRGGQFIDVGLVTLRD